MNFEEGKSHSSIAQIINSDRYQAIDSAHHVEYEHV